MEVKRQRIILFDFLKIIAMCFVIFQHLFQFSDIGSSLLFPLAINQAVPVFLMISAFLYSEKNKNNSLRSCYNFKFLAYKVLYFAIPSVLVYLIYHFKSFTTLNGIKDFLRLVSYFIMGQYGLGSYYFGILFQFFLLMPLILWSIKNSRRGGVVIIFIIGLLSEILFNLIPNCEKYYRVLFFRYLFVCGIACWFSVYRNSVKISKLFLILTLLLGLAYHILPKIIIGYSPFFVLWRSTNTINGFYIAPIFYFFILLSEKFKSQNNFLSFISLTASSTYMVMCVQMLFFRFDVGSWIQNSAVLLCIFAIAFCFAIGVISYVIYSVFDKKLLKRIITVKKKNPD